MSAVESAASQSIERFRWTASQIAAMAIAGVVAVLVVTPIASLVVTAFSGDGDLWPHLLRYVLPVALTQTALLLAGVAVVTSVIGVAAAWTVTTFEFPARRTLAALLPLPLAIPTYLAAYIYVDLLDALGPVQSALRAVFGWHSFDAVPQIRSLAGAIFIFSVSLYPYVYLAARAMFQTQCALYVDAARVLGGRPFRIARQITLPLARPAIAVGLALALMETLNDIGASEYLGVPTLTLSVFSTYLNRGSLAGAAQIALVMLVIVAALVALERYGRRNRSIAGVVQDPQDPPRIALAGGMQWLAVFVCLVPIALGFLVPAAFLAREVVVRGLLVGFDMGLLRHALSTLTYAVAATSIVLVLGFGIVGAVRWFRHPFVTASAGIAGVGYAVPATLLAIGLLYPLVALDEGINWLTHSFAGVTVGLVMAGSGAAVVTAYVIRYLAISAGFAQAGFDRIAGDLDEAARVLGARPGKVLRTVDLPLARPAIVGAAFLVFVDCLKELPATLLLRPLNVETLSTYVYQFASRGSFEEGSLAALLIVLAGTVPIIRMIRYADVAPGIQRGATTR